ncbi:carbon-nitrogen hydrolase family protein [Prochlorococcus marinus]|uniref:carbon-nitrogen hydrolase family protein n=1 Tax=Prochlorococcus marinus TaxID=1219 RepID=UPI0022B5A7E2|nr:carbon-nitrogen hydrolase family protein [Prochlorococcus marinus]
MSDFLAAAVQLTSTSNIEGNFSAAEEQIELASRRGADLVGLPENFAFIGEDQHRLEISSTLAEKCSQFLITMARRYQVVLLGGGFPVPAGDGQRTLNRAELVGCDGQLLGRYDKIHLFDVDLPDGNKYQESETIVSGKELPSVIDIPGLCKVGLSICYDVRFPELFRYLVDEGAELLMIPAAFTAFTGKDHWQVLLQSRAIENTAYVVAPAQTGEHYRRRQSHGHAMIIDPWGTVLADAGVEPGASIAPVDTARVKSIRSQMPCLKHRKKDLF